MNEYRVNLELYNGPLDLLLYLIRREELDIYDIPISRITAQYLQYVQMMNDLDPNLAGEFLVLAATLIEIKTRMLLPTPPPEEGGQAGVEIDPRAELVRQLLEYKAFKDASADLADAAHLRAQKFPRRPFLPEADPTELDMEDIQLWDLLDAFGKLMESIGKKPGAHEVVYDDTPVELHAADIVDRLQREGPLTFQQVFEGRTTRSEIVGLFMAMLELVRQKKIFAEQGEVFGEIRICLNANPPGDAGEGEVQPDDIIRGDQHLVDQGQYVPQADAPADATAANDAEDADDAAADNVPGSAGHDETFGDSDVLESPTDVNAADSPAESEEPHDDTGTEDRPA